MCRIETHSHSDVSNLRLLDSTNRIDEMILKAHELGLKGIAITDHESVGNHIKAIQCVRKFKENGDLPEDFKLLLGNEIYLVDSIEDVRDNYVGGVTKFPHFLMIAKNKDGHEAIRKLSSIAWGQSFYTGPMERVPTTKAQLAEVVSQYPNSLIATTACFLEDALVTVDGTLKQISQIKEGEIVTTHKANKQKIVIPTSREYSGDIHTLRTSGATFNVTSTSDHKFLVVESQKHLRKVSDFKEDYDKKAFDFYKEIRFTEKSDKMKRMASRKPKWIEAKDLSNEHSVLRLIDEKIENVEHLNLSKYHKENAKRHLPEILNVTPDLLWILGFYVAEGSLASTASGINFATHCEKTHIHERIINYFSSLGFHVSHYKKNHGKGYSLSVSSIELYDWFKEMIGSGALNKKVPSFIKALPFEKQLWFMRGYFQGDGHYRKRQLDKGFSYEVGFSTISPQLAYDITGIIARMGLNMSLSTTPAKTGKDGVSHQQHYTGCLGGSIAYRFIEAIFNEKEWQLPKTELRFIDIPFYWEGRKYLTCPIRENQVKQYKGKVYCLNVEHDHSFEAQGMVVHNCLGSESSIHIMNGDYDKAKSFIEWCANVFGKDSFFLEIQPSKDAEQRKVNEWLVGYSKESGLGLIVSNDVHYLRPEDAPIHAAFLNAQGGEREAEKFYAHTYLHTNHEIYDKLDYLDKDDVTSAITNTLKIGEMCEDYTIENDTIIPKIKLPEFQVMHFFKAGYEMYPSIKAMAYSEEEQDRYLLFLIEKGFIKHIPFNTMTKEEFHRYIARIDIELEQLYEVSLRISQPMSSYYVTISKVCELIWGDECTPLDESSLLGPGRGSAVAFFINFLLDVTSVNPLAYGIEVPYWRHLDKERADVESLDVDVDVVSFKKSYIYERIKGEFGDDRFLQVCTYGTETSKSAIQTACRGLGIDSDEAKYITSMIPFERGKNWTISDCLYGNEKKSRKPVKEFIKEMMKYEGLTEAALKIEGLISKRGVHAGGVIIFNESYHKSNAMMKSPNGTLVTQFNLDDSQAAGNIKYDILSIEALDKLYVVIELLLDDGVIEWKGSLKRTFQEYFHPEKIDKLSPELFDIAGSGKVIDLFQFSTELGQSVVQKVKPRKLIDLTAANSIMRLHTDQSEQPIDTFIRFKNNIQDWYQEMTKFGLTKEEQKTFEEHLLPLNGVADTQESIMLMAMDKRIGDFTKGEANTLRKAVAKLSKEALEKTLSTLYANAEKNGVRKEVVDYFWNYQVSRMLSYAFSIPHVLAYTLLAMIQLNLNHYYNPLYWQTAVLTVNSGSLEVEEGEKSKGTDYGKTAKAIGSMKSYGVNVDLPLINKAKFGFTPDIANNRILFGMKGINGIGDEVIYKIIENRPYNSFEDFYDRMYVTKVVQRSQVLQLIKAGAFNEFASQVEIMKRFVVKEVDTKETLDGQNLSRAINLGLLDNEQRIKYKDYYNFRVFLKKKVQRKQEKPKNRFFLLDDLYAVSYFHNNFSEDSVDEVLSDGSLIIDEKKFDKEYKKMMEPFMEELATEEFVREFNIHQFYELWAKHAQGTVSKWHMDSVSFYADEHELAVVNKGLYNIVDFDKLPKEPIAVGEYKGRDGRMKPQYANHTIIGTVVDKDKNKHIVSLLTETGVVSVKLYGNQFSSLDRQIKIDGKIVEKSVFTRGNKLMVHGIRRGDRFTVRAPQGDVGIKLITDIKEDGSLSLQSGRTR